MERPSYPVKVVFFEKGEKVEEEIYENEMEMCCDLEWFDSEVNTPEDTTIVTDRLGREVVLKIEALELIKFELKDKDKR
ncbi:hypothetical protein LQ236_000330 [Nitrospina gracilis]|uniref:hypothetical protein n=1 Tax=Nitrospina sp. Nb-3 TaxID=2940485 RepID=UPI001F3949FB|nr:hypothetical protein [Nitrospina sp. Nb-3]MCF8722310.1 hypothetical protein [Nitrospina sp. Nb-3]